MKNISLLIFKIKKGINIYFFKSQYFSLCKDIEWGKDVEKGNRKKLWLERVQ